MPYISTFPADCLLRDVTKSVVMRRENACLHGRFLAFEIITETGKASKLQEVTIQRIREAKDKAFTVRSAAEAAAGVNRLEVGMTVCRLSDPVIQRIFLLYYLENKSWRDTAGDMNYSPAQTYRYLDVGYTELEEILKTA